MKRLRIEALGGARALTRLTRPRPRCPFMPQQHHPIQPQCRQIPIYRLQSTTSDASESPAVADDLSSAIESESAELESLPSPPVSAARESAKLSALHARLSLPSRLPLETLARTLVDPSADPNPDFNNAALATLGGDFLTFYTSEHIICHYPRIPMPVLLSAMRAFVGNHALLSVAREWGVENAAAPGGEVDPGLLQFTSLQPGTEFLPWRRGTGRPNEHKGQGWRHSVSSSIVYDDAFGEARGRVMTKDPQGRVKAVAKEEAAAGFVRAVVGAVYAHGGRAAAQQFTAAHFLTRHLDLSQLFNFTNPTRDLSKLCAREGFEAPIARLVAETGRESRHPVFVVGVFSGRDKLGEGAGSSLDEARVRAAAAALKSWYLYSPLDVTKPSEAESGRENKKWVPNLVDVGEIIV